MKNRTARTIAGACLVALCPGCASNLYFGTSTSVGLSVVGTGKIPTKVSFAHDRTETAIVPVDAAGKVHSTFAALDSEWTWMNGFIIKQQFATGRAADIAAQSSFVAAEGNFQPEKITAEKPILFITSSKLGIAIDFGETPQSPASLLVGYRRHEGTLMPDARGKQALDSVYADISIISDAKDLPPDTPGPRLGGVRIKQRFATGVAAINAVTDPGTRKELRKAVLGDPVHKAIGQSIVRFDQEAAVTSGFQKLKAAQQAGYLAVLNQTFGRSGSSLITGSNLQVEAGKFTDAQLAFAVEHLNQP